MGTAGNPHRAMTQGLPEGGGCLPDIIRNIHVKLYTAGDLDVPWRHTNATKPPCVFFGLRSHPADAFDNRCCHAPKDRKSTRLNSSHVRISYAVFCLKKKK